MRLPLPRLRRHAPCAYDVVSGGVVLAHVAWWRQGRLWEWSWTGQAPSSGFATLRQVRDYIEFTFQDETGR